MIGCGKSRTFGYVSKNIYYTLYHHKENSAVEFKDRMILLTVHNKKRKRFGIELHKLFGGNGYMYDRAVYLKQQVFSAV